MEKVKTPEEQFVLLEEGFDNLLQGVMLMPVSDELKVRVFSFIAYTMENLTRLTKDMFKREVGE